MKCRRKLALLLLAMILILSVATYLGGAGSGGTEPYVYTNPDYVEYPYFEDLLAPWEMVFDMVQLKRNIEEVHPATEPGLPPEFDSLFREALLQVEKELTVGDFYAVVSPLLGFLGDAHTFILPPYWGRFLPAELVFIGDKLFVKGGVNLQAGDEILALGGVAVDEIIAYGNKVISRENPYWLKKQIPALLNTGILLQLGAELCDWRTLEVELRRNGEVMKVKMNFGQSYRSPASDQALVHSDSDLYSYYLEPQSSLCVFRQKECNYDREYSDFLASMFEAIGEKGIENIVVDLRGNPGGSSAAVVEFLTHIDIDEYITYGCYTRVSDSYIAEKGLSTIGELAPKKARVVKNKKKELVFGGDIYVLVDNGTFSAANIFTVVLADNHIATVVGEPTGNAPNFYADVVDFQLKNSKLLYYISSCEFTRPDTSTDRSKDAFYPDYPVDYSLESYVLREDLALNEVLRLIEGKR